VGNDRLDKQFDKIGVAPKQQPWGAYHYYRPNENSLEQARSSLKRFL
jgi:lysozyme